MIRFSHTLFALPFALLAAVMAWTAGARLEPRVAFRWQELLGIVLCMVAARSAAMAFNRVADWRLDARQSANAIAAHSRRRAQRQQCRGLCGRLFDRVRRWPRCCSCPTGCRSCLSLPVLAFLLAYSFTKRFTAAAHFWLGAALMLAPISAWIAIRGEQVLARPADLLPALVLGGAVLLWVAGFDIIYACQDVDFDRQAGLHSVPARLGVARALRLAALCHLGMIVLLAVLIWVYPLLGWIYVAGVAAVAVLLAYEHWLVRPDDLTRVNIAFFQVNAVVSIGLFVVASLDLFASAKLLR